MGAFKSWRIGGIPLVAFLLSCMGGEKIIYIYTGSSGDTKAIIEAERSVKAFLSPSSVKLKKAENCEEVEEYVEALMEKYAEKMIDRMREEQGYWWEMEVATDYGTAKLYSALPETGEGDISHSETTVQERGIDEADVVKTDGERIYASLQGKLIVVRSYPTDGAELLAEISLDSNDYNHDYYNYYQRHEMLIEGDKIFVFSGGYRTPYNYYHPSDGFNIFEFEGLSDPERIRTISIEGRYITARKKEGKIYVVGNFTPTEFFSTSGTIFAKIIDEARKHDFDIQKVKIDVDFDDIKGIFPKVTLGKSIGYSVTSGISTYEEEITVNCSNVFISSNASGLNVAFVILIDDGTPKITYVIGVGSESSIPFVYMSPRSIYLAYNQDRWFWGGSEIEKTDVHRFDISGNGVVYSSSGEVEGRISVVWGRTGQKNAELSMNEYNEFFRIATSKGYFGNSDNIVSVLKESDGKLEVVGQVKGIAPGELIHSVRFIGDRGFIVTFKKTDPFFTIDLTDPQNPMVVGELKVSGYSSLILPFDDNHVLAIGKETEEADTGDFAWFQGVQLSIFDVSDFSSPELLHRIEVGSRGTESEALFDYRALTFYKGVLSLPITLFEGGEGGWDFGEFRFSGFSVYNVSLERGFEHMGYIKGCECDVEDEYENDCRWSWYYNCEPIRSVIIEGTIWTSMLAGNGLSFIATDLDSFATVNKIEVKL